MIRLLLIIAVILGSTPAFAHDPEHPELEKWYSEQMQPDNPEASCCGPADAYWCDDVFTRGAFNYCRITDDRLIPGRTPHPKGLEIQIPDRKFMNGKKSKGNPTGHSIVWLTSGSDPAVYCFILGTGI